MLRYFIKNLPGLSSRTEISPHKCRTRLFRSLSPAVQQKHFLKRSRSCMRSDVTAEDSVHDDWLASLKDLQCNPSKNTKSHKRIKTNRVGVRLTEGEEKYQDCLSTTKFYTSEQYELEAAKPHRNKEISNKNIFQSKFGKKHNHYLQPSVILRSNSNIFPDLGFKTNRLFTLPKQGKERDREHGKRSRRQDYAQRSYSTLKQKEAIPKQLIENLPIKGYNQPNVLSKTKKFINLPKTISDYVANIETVKTIKDSLSTPNITFNKNSIFSTTNENNEISIKDKECSSCSNIALDKKIKSSFNINATPSSPFQHFRIKSPIDLFTTQPLKFRNKSAQNHKRNKKFMLLSPKNSSKRTIFFHSNAQPKVVALSTKMVLNPSLPFDKLKNVKKSPRREDKSKLKSMQKSADIKSKRIVEKREKINHFKNWLKNRAKITQLESNFIQPTNDRFKSIENVDSANQNIFQPNPVNISLSELYAKVKSDAKKGQLRQKKHEEPAVVGRERKHTHSFIFKKEEAEEKLSNSQTIVQHDQKLNKSPVVTGYKNLVATSTKLSVDYRQIPTQYKFNDNRHESESQYFSHIPRLRNYSFKTRPNNVTITKNILPTQKYSEKKQNENPSKRSRFLSPVLFEEVKNSSFSRDHNLLKASKSRTVDEIPLIKIKATQQNENNKEIPNRNIRDLGFKKMSLKNDQDKESPVLEMKRNEEQELGTQNFIFGHKKLGQNSIYSQNNSEQNSESVRRQSTNFKYSQRKDSKSESTKKHISSKRGNQESLEIQPGNTLTSDLPCFRDSKVNQEPPKLKYSESLKPRKLLKLKLSSEVSNKDLLKQSDVDFINKEHNQSSSKLKSEENLHKKVNLVHAEMIRNMTAYPNYQVKDPEQIENIEQLIENTNISTTHKNDVLDSSHTKKSLSTVDDRKQTTGASKPTELQPFLELPYKVDIKESPIKTESYHISEAPKKITNFKRVDFQTILKEPPKENTPEITPYLGQTAQSTNADGTKVVLKSFKPNEKRLQADTQKRKPTQQLSEGAKRIMASYKYNAKSSVAQLHGNQTSQHLNQTTKKLVGLEASSKVLGDINIKYNNYNNNNSIQEITQKPDIPDSRTTKQLNKPINQTISFEPESQSFLDLRPQKGGQESIEPATNCTRIDKPNFLVYTPLAGGLSNLCDVSVHSTQITEKVNNTIPLKSDLSNSENSKETFANNATKVLDCMTEYQTLTKKTKRDQAKDSNQKINVAPTLIKNPVNISYNLASGEHSKAVEPEIVPKSESSGKSNEIFLDNAKKILNYILENQPCLNKKEYEKTMSSSYDHIRQTLLKSVEKETVTKLLNENNITEHLLKDEASLENGVFEKLLNLAHLQNVAECKSALKLEDKIGYLLSQIMQSSSYVTPLSSKRKFGGSVRNYSNNVLTSSASTYNIKEASASKESSPLFSLIPDMYTNETQNKQLDKSSADIFQGTIKNKQTTVRLNDVNFLPDSDFIGKSKTKDVLDKMCTNLPVVKDRILNHQLNPIDETFIKLVSDKELKKLKRRNKKYLPCGRIFFSEKRRAGQTLMYSKNLSTTANVQYLPNVNIETVDTLPQTIPYTSITDQNFGSLYFAKNKDRNTSSVYQRNETRNHRGSVFIKHSSKKQIGNQRKRPPVPAYSDVIEEYINPFKKKGLPQHIQQLKDNADPKFRSMSDTIDVPKSIQMNVPFTGKNYPQLRSFDLEKSKIPRLRKIGVITNKDLKRSDNKSTSCLISEDKTTAAAQTKKDVSSTVSLERGYKFITLNKACAITTDKHSKRLNYKPTSYLTSRDKTTAAAQTKKDASSTVSLERRSAFITLDKECGASFKDRNFENFVPNVHLQKGIAITLFPKVFAATQNKLTKNVCKSTTHLENGSGITALAKEPAATQNESIKKVCKSTTHLENGSRISALAKEPATIQNESIKNVCASTIQLEKISEITALAQEPAATQDESIKNVCESTIHLENEITTLAKEPAATLNESMKNICESTIHLENVSEITALAKEPDATQKDPIKDVSESSPYFENGFKTTALEEEAGANVIDIKKIDDSEFNTYLQNELAITSLPKVPARRNSFSCPVPRTLDPASFQDNKEFDDFGSKIYVATTSPLLKMSGKTHSLTLCAVDKMPKPLNFESQEDSVKLQKDLENSSELPLNSEHQYKHVFIDKGATACESEKEIHLEPTTPVQVTNKSVSRSNYSTAEAQKYIESYSKQNLEINEKLTSFLTSSFKGLKKSRIPVRKKTGVSKRRQSINLDADNGDFVIDLQKKIVEFINKSIFYQNSELFRFTAKVESVDVKERNDAFLTLHIKSSKNLCDFGKGHSLLMRKNSITENSRQFSQSSSRSNVFSEKKKSKNQLSKINKILARTMASDPRNEMKGCGSRCQSKKKMMQILCKKESNKAPYPAFTECLPHELRQELSQDLLELDKANFLQPQLQVPYQNISLVEPVSPPVSTIDFNKEEICVKAKLGLEREGLSQNCDNFGKLQKPMRQRDYLPIKSNSCSHFDINCKIKDRKDFSTYVQSNVFSTFKNQQRSLYNKAYNFNQENEEEKAASNRTYHFFCKVADKRMAKATEINSVMKHNVPEPDDDCCTFMKLRNLQWRINNFQKWHRLNRLNNCQDFIKRYYSSLTNYMSLPTSDLVDISTSDIQNNRILPKFQQILEINKNFSSNYIHKKNHLNYILPPRKQFEQKKSVCTKSKSLTSFKPNKNPKTGKYKGYDECLCDDREGKQLQPKYPILPEQVTVTNLLFPEPVDLNIKSQYLRHKHNIPSEGVSLDCDNFAESISTGKIRIKDYFKEKSTAGDSKCKEEVKMKLVPKEVVPKENHTVKMEIPAIPKKAVSVAAVKKEVILPHVPLCPSENIPNISCTPLNEKLSVPVSEFFIDSDYFPKKIDTCEYLRKNPSQCSPSKKCIPDKKCVSIKDDCSTPSNDCTQPPVPPQKEEKKTAATTPTMWNKIVEYFKARPNCPPPDEWKKKAAKEKAERYAKVAGLVVCDPKILEEANKKLKAVPEPPKMEKKCERLPQVITCPSPSKRSLSYWSIAKLPGDHRRSKSLGMNPKQSPVSFNEQINICPGRLLCSSHQGRSCQKKYFTTSARLEKSDGNSKNDDTTSSSSQEHVGDAVKKLSQTKDTESNDCGFEEFDDEIEDKSAKNIIGDAKFRENTINVLTRRCYSEKGRNKNIDDINRALEEKDKQRLAEKIIRSLLEASLNHHNQQEDETCNRGGNEFDDPRSGLEEEKILSRRTSFMDMFREPTDEYSKYYQARCFANFMDTFNKIEVLPDVSYEDIEKMKTKKLVNELNKLIVDDGQTEK